MASHEAEQACIFLPGIIAPAVVRYAALIGELGSAARAYTKELEVYTLTPTPHGFSIGDEIDGLLAHTSRAGLERFHLYGHSGGGAIALAFTAAHPQRVLSLALDEAAFDFSAEMRAQLAEHDELREGMRNDPANAMRRFMQLELKPGVEFSPPAGGIPPLPNRPGGVAALVRAFLQYELDDDALRAFDRPVLYTRGSLSADRYEQSARRLATLFPDFREIVFDGLHHLNTSHQAEPAKVAALLIDLWSSPGAEHPGVAVPESVRD